MKRNPINILNDTMQQAFQLIEMAIRAAIHCKRAKKFNKIDLRHYKSSPDKKERIRKIINLENLKAIYFLSQMIISRQPIRKHDFDKGDIIAEINYK